MNEQESGIMDMYGTELEGSEYAALGLLLESLKGVYVNEKTLAEVLGITVAEVLRLEKQGVFKRENVKTLEVDENTKIYVADKDNITPEEHAKYMVMTVKDVGKIMKEYREMRGLTVREAAADSGVSAAVISKIENARWEPLYSFLSLLEIYRHTFWFLPLGK